MQVRLQMLGPAHVLVDADTHSLKPTIRDQALAYLACAGGPVTRDHLGFLFWADTPDTKARHNVRQLLKRMRQLPWAQGLRADDVNVHWSIPNDVADLRRALEEESWDALPESGELLAGMERGATIEYEEWLLAERRRVGEQWRKARMAAASEAAGRGDPAQGAALLEPLLDDDDGRTVLPLYMEMAARAGDRDGALGALEMVGAKLHEELGADLPPEAIEMADRISDIGDRSAEPDRRPLVGRTADLNQIAAAIGKQECRLLTLLGPGGIGKSTMASMLIERMAASYDDGGHLVSLENVTDPTSIAAVVATGLGVALDPRGDAMIQLVEALRTRHMLLALDNVEHLPAGWVVISELIESCPALDVVVTSRERLRLAGEWVHEVPGLTEEEGAELFRQIGRRVAPDAEVADEDAAAVSRAVGGSPLGIELAAPWLRAMPAEDIAIEISTNPDILRGGPRDTANRHRSIEAAMQHSWTLISAEERDVIEALSVFAGPFDRDLAMTVAEASPVVLRDLVDKSLLQLGRRGFYGIHPLVRQHARGRLAADDLRRQTVRDRHAVAVLGLLEETDDVSGLREMIEDVIEAWQRALENRDLEIMGRSARGFADLIETTGRIRQGLELVSKTTAQITAEDRGSEWTAAAIRQSEAQLLYRSGLHSEAAEVAQDALDAATRADDAAIQVHALLTLGWARKWLVGDRAQHEVISDALPIARSLADDDLVASVLNGLGCSAATLTLCREHLVEGLTQAPGAKPARRIVLMHNLGMVIWGLGDNEEARRHLEEALRVAVSQDLPHLRMQAMASLAFVRSEADDLEGALEQSAEAESQLGSSESLDDRIYLTLVAGEIRRLVGDTAGARSRVHDALRLSAAIGNDPFALRALRLHACLLIDCGQVDEGLRVLAFVVSRTPEKGGDFTSEIINPRVWREATADLPDEVVDAAREWAEGRELTEVITASLASTLGTV